MWVQSGGEVVGRKVIQFRKSPRGSEWPGQRLLGQPGERTGGEVSTKIKIYKNTPEANTEEAAGHL